MGLRSRGAFGRGAALVLVDGAEQRPGKPLAGAAVGDLADIDREHLTAGSLDAVDQLALDFQAATKPVEVCGHDDLGLAGLNALNGRPQALALL